MNSERNDRPIPEKANKILNLMLILLFLIGARIWQLTLFQHDEKIEESTKPKMRTLVQKPPRASIRDRFNLPLAHNVIQYNASIVFSKIKEVPQTVYENGKKINKRKQYVKELSSKLAIELNMDKERIEDLIWAKGALLGHVPLLLKEEISEAEFYRLKGLEKDWPGIFAECVPKRFYPQGKVACDVVGYMGAISKEEFDRILNEIRSLKEIIKNQEMGEEIQDIGFDPRKRLKELQERAYSINDYIGKSGIECAFDEHLRGFRGKKSYYSDIKGQILKELPGAKTALSGKRFLLTISSELQEFAEALLAENERIREGKSVRLNRKTYTYETIKQPWIKGGAIIVMDPNNGEILTLASYPRFDPNDFIFSSDSEKRKEQKSNVYQWLEHDFHVAELWDEKRALTKELYSFKEENFYEEAKLITWDNYLDFILPKSHPIIETFQNFGKLQHVIKVLQNVKNLFYQTNEARLSLAFDHLNEEPYKEIKKNLEPYFTKLQTSYDRVLFTDLCQILVDETLFSKELIQAVGKKSVGQYKTECCAYTHMCEETENVLRKLFHEIDFAKWKESNEQEYLKQMRALEKENKTYQKPYLDYLDKKENELFTSFWKRNKTPMTYVMITGHIPSNYKDNPYCKILLQKRKDSPHLDLLENVLAELEEPLGLQYLSTFRSFSDLKRQLYGKYPSLRSLKGIQLEKHLASAFYPKHGFGYGRSYAFRQASQLGSIFKMVTAYAALIAPYKRNFYSSEYTPSLHDLNPLVFIDDMHLNKLKSSTWNVGYDEHGNVIPQFYKGGRIPKSQHSHIGKVNLQEAIETSSNPYFALLAGEVLETPLDLLEGAKQFSFGTKTGIALPGEISGKLPQDLQSNKSGLYAFAIGQHSFVSTSLQTAVMLSAIANKGKVLEPKIVLLQAGKDDTTYQDDPFEQEDFPYKNDLLFAGIDFPLFTAIPKEIKENSVDAEPSTIKRKIFLPECIRTCLMNAMKKVIKGDRGTGRPSTIRTFAARPQVIKDYSELQEEIVGKTSTAEVVERVDLSQDGLQTINHIGFACISFEPSDEPFEKPELVVVVYLKYGDYGKEAAPIAAQMIKKWREIKQKHEQ